MDCPFHLGRAVVPAPPCSPDTRKFRSAGWVDCCIDVVGATSDDSRVGPPVGAVITTVVGTLYGATGRVN